MIHVLFLGLSRVSPKHVDPPGYILLPKRREKGSATQTMPPKVFPKVTSHLLKELPQKIDIIPFGFPK